MKNPHKIRTQAVHAGEAVDPTTGASAPNIIMSSTFVVKGEKRTISAGDVLVIPGDVLHGGVALEPSMTLEAFAPPRENFLAKLEG